MGDEEGEIEPADAAAERRRMALAARRFFLEDRSKVEIGNELGMSRFKVARLLEQARASGVVTITVHDSGMPVPALAGRLCRHLGLTNAVVVEAGSAPDDVRSAVGTAAARLLGETLGADEVVGLSWGRTLAAMSASLPELPRVTVVQLTGAAGVNLEDSPVEIVRQVALRSGGSAYPIFAPLVVDDAAMAVGLRRQPGVAAAFALFEHLTVAVVSVGSWDPPDSQLFSYFPIKERNDLCERGVVAEVVATLIADDGSWPAPEMADRSVAIPGEKLRRVPRIIAAAGGADKTRAVRAAVLAGLCTELVTDRSLAEAVLALPPLRRTTGAARSRGVT